MQTTTDKLKVDGEALLKGVITLLGENAPLRDINADDSGLVFIGPHMAFPDLPVEKKRLQSRLLEDLRHFASIIQALLARQPSTIQKEFTNHTETIKQIIEQTHLVWHRTGDAAKEAVRKAINELIELLEALHDPAEGVTVLVPDTNALIYSPSFQNWTFEELPSFEILLVPMLLSELDALKNEHRNQDVRQKAQEVIRQIKEYRRRGPLNDGVDIISGRIRLRSIAVEPTFDAAIPWLDSQVPDDRMIASCVEVMRIHPRSVVAIVTSDINLQNKAEFMRVPFVEPPA